MGVNSDRGHTLLLSLIVCQITCWHWRILRGGDTTLHPGKVMMWCMLSQKQENVTMTAFAIHPHTPAHTACLQSSMNWVEPAGRFETWLFLSLQSTEDKSMDIFQLVERPSSCHTLLLVNWVMVLSRQCAESHDKSPWCTSAFKSLTKVPRKHARLLQTSCPLHICPRVLWWVTIYYYVLFTLLPPYQTLISINIFIIIH